MATSVDDALLISLPRARADKLGGFISAGLLAIFACTALAFGSVEPWAIALFELTTAGLLALWVVRVLIRKELTLNIPAVVYPVAGLLLIGLVQSVSITGGDGTRLSLSMDVDATRSTVVVLTFMLIAMMLAANFLGSEKRLSMLANFLTFFGLSLALFALVQYFSWNGRFYWIRPNTVSASPFGPFVNHNHFAGYMELLIPMPIALIVARAVKGEAAFLYGFAAVVMSIATCLSLSRGGMVSLAGGLIFVALLGARLRSQRNQMRGRRAKGSRAGSYLRNGLPVVAIIGAIVLGMLWIGADPVFRRVTHNEQAPVAQSETLYNSRGWVWKDSLRMIGANPIFGVGLGAFRTAYSRYTESDGSIIVPQAHNDYLQAVADGGIGGGLVALCFIFLVFKAVRTGLKSEDATRAAVALGCGGAIFAMLIHSLFDFNLQLPSNALLFLALSGVVSRVGARAPAPRRLARQDSRVGYEPSYQPVALQRG